MFPDRTTSSLVPPHRSGWEEKPYCGQQHWSVCHRIDCQWHLASERIQRQFPGRNGPWHFELLDALKHDQGTVNCHLTDWHACLHDNCQKHSDRSKSAASSQNRERSNPSCPGQACGDQHTDPHASLMCNSIRHVNVPVNIDGQRTIAMIDSKAT